MDSENQKIQRFFKDTFFTLLRTLQKEWKILSPRNYELFCDYLAGDSSVEDLAKKYSVDADMLESIVGYSREVTVQGIRFFSLSARPIDMLELSKRARNALLGMGVRSVSELVWITRSEFKKKPKVGEAITNEIEEKLLKFGLSFKKN